MRVMARVDTRQKRSRGLIDRLPSGSLRVRVYAGYDSVTEKRHYLSETVPARASEQETLREAEKVRTRLVNQVDERRNPRTRTTMNQLLDRWLEVVQLEKTTRQGYVGKIDKHLRPTIGKLPVARVDAESIESLYAQLRTCKEHCHGRQYVEHRTSEPHVCDEHEGDACRPAKPESCRACGRLCQPHVLQASERRQHPGGSFDPQGRAEPRRSLELDRGEPHWFRGSAADPGTGSLPALC